MSRKRSKGSSSSRGSQSSKNTSPYGPDFEMMMLDQGVYPPDYDHEDQELHEPANLESLRQCLARSRASLSPSRCTEADFREFKKLNRRAETESGAMSSVVPIIAGRDDSRCRPANEVLFNNMQKFHEDLTLPKPDRYYGTQPSRIHLRVRQELDQYITPSTHNTRPAAPNCFFAGKGSSGRADVARRQAVYDGAIGARAMHRLQNYGKPDLEYDGKSYTIASSYHPGTTTLQIYATHPGPPAGEGGHVQYYTTQIRAYTLNNSVDDFRLGAQAYRNGREWAQQQRESFITSANELATQLPRRAPQPLPRSGHRPASTQSLEQAHEIEPETSADELASGEYGIAKRSRCSTPPKNLPR